MKRKVKKLVSKEDKVIKELNKLNKTLIGMKKIGYFEKITLYLVAVSVAISIGALVISSSTYYIYKLEKEPRVTSSQVTCPPTLEGNITVKAELMNHGLLTNFNINMSTEGFECSSNYGGCFEGGLISSESNYYFEFSLIPEEGHEGNHKYRIDLTYNRFGDRMDIPIKTCIFNKEKTSEGYVYKLISES